MFLDTLPGFNYNTGSGEYIVDDQGQRRANDTRNLGSTLMKTMLNEVKDFCDPDIKENWSHKQHQQVCRYVHTCTCTCICMVCGASGLDDPVPKILMCVC